LAKEKTVKLAALAKGGDTCAFEELIREKQKGILFSVYSKVGNSEDAEDITQEVILSMYKYIGKLREPEYVNAWIYRIVNDKVNKHLRKHTKIRYERIEEATEEEGTFEDNVDFLPEQYVESKELSDELFDVVMSLPEKRRDAIIWYYYEGLSVKEIAEAADISIKTATSNLSRARSMIRDRMVKAEKKAKRESNDKEESSRRDTAIGRVMTDHVNVIFPRDRVKVFECAWIGALGREAADNGLLKNNCKL
jgi:RNA polymerase sigma-70 factor (ECF subfamily)